MISVNSNGNPVFTDVTARYLPVKPQSSQPPSVNYPPLHSGLAKKMSKSPTLISTFSDFLMYSTD